MKRNVFLWNVFSVVCALKISDTLNTIIQRHTLKLSWFLTSDHNVLIPTRYVGIKAVNIVNYARVRPTHVNVAADVVSGYGTGSDLPVSRCTFTLTLDVRLDSSVPDERTGPLLCWGTASAKLKAVGRGGRWAGSSCGS